jgi:hypothetical protein
MPRPGFRPALLVSVALLGCGSPQPLPQSSPDDAQPPLTVASPVPASAACQVDQQAVGGEVEGLVLPDLTGVFSAGDEPAGRLDQVEITIRADGAASLGPLVYAEPWRGIDLPRAGPVVGPPTIDLNEVRARLALAAGGVSVRLGSRRCTSWQDVTAEVEAHAARMRASTGGRLCDFVVEARPDVPAGHVITLLGLLLQRGLPVKLAAPQASEPHTFDAELHGALATLTSGARRDEQGVRLVGVRLRTDTRAPWSAVQRALAAVTRALIDRITFAGVSDDATVDLYPRRAAEAPTDAAESGLDVEDPGLALSERGPSPTETGSPEVVERPIIVLEEEVEVAEDPATVVAEPPAAEEPPATARGDEPADTLRELELGLEGLNGEELDVDVPDLDADPLDAGPAGERPYAQRRERAAQLEAEGGDADTEAAVDAALRWLVHHQRADGSWDGDGWTAQCGRGQSLPACAGPGANAGAAQTDVALTALSLMALLGQGDPGVGPYQASVTAGLRWLRGQQRDDGGFGTLEPDGRFASEWMTYPQPLATIALCEAYALTGDAELRQAARRAVDFCLLAQNPGLGWKYGVKPGRNDTAVTGWMVAALRAGERAGFEVPAEALQGARSWFARATDGNGHVGYETPGGGSAFLAPNDGKYDQVPAMTAVALHARLDMGEARETEALTQAATILSANKPTWSATGTRTVNFYYWYHGTNAMFQVGAEPWARWSDSLQAVLLPTQRDAGCEAGSWDPVGEWCLSGGRVYATAINALTLQAYYRFQRR